MHRDLGRGVTLYQIVDRGQHFVSVQAADLGDAEEGKGGAAQQRDGPPKGKERSTVDGFFEESGRRFDHRQRPKQGCDLDLPRSLFERSLMKPWLLKH